MTPIPLLDLTAQYATIRTEVEKALLQVVESQHFILGAEVEKLEKALAGYLECKHAVGVSSGTDALLVALMAIDLRPGDEVIVPTYSFFATAGVVARLQAVPVFVDIDPLTFNIDPGRIEPRITARTRAIIPVHLFGQSAEMDELMRIARQHGLRVIEDAAQAIGAQYRDGRRAGSIGDLGCFSFFPTKNLGCFGDGGLVTTQDAELAEKLRVLRVHGARPKYYHKIIGGNFRLDAIQAAVLNAKLPHLDGWSAKRRQNADVYSRLFVAAGLARDGAPPGGAEGDPVVIPQAVYRGSAASSYHVYNQYVIRVRERARLRPYLADKGIGTEIYYPVPFHRQECFASLRCRDQDYPQANTAADTSLALPMFPELSEPQLEFVVQAIRDFYR